ncbi:MAG: hypothetical protein VW683_01555 [Betaproteobacteria bacterium]|jgi:hypothetical protein
MSKILQKFEEQKVSIYDRFSNKTSLTGQELVEPILEIKPDAPDTLPPGRRIISPMNDKLYSTAGETYQRNLARITQFENVPRILQFLDNQTFIQRIQTFQNTRVLDRELLVKGFGAQEEFTRHFAEPPIAPSTDGLLQSETTESIKEKVKYNIYNQRGSLLLRDDDTRGVIDRGTDALRDRIRGGISSALNWLLSPLDNFLEDLGVSSGPDDRQLRERSSRPELAFVGEAAQRSSTYFDYLKEKYKTDDNFRDNLLRLVAQNRRNESMGKPSDRNSGNLTGYTSYDNRVSYKDFVEFVRNNYVQEREPRPDILRKHNDRRRHVRYFKDLTQVPQGSRTGIEVPDNEATGDKYDSDHIDFMFHSKSGDERVRVRFRALLDRMKETITPTYTTKNYLGRIENFYIYDTIERNVQLAFFLQAWSELELEHIWQKMNYLTALAYPQDYSGGYPTPNISFLTMGTVYERQPIIVRSLVHDFLEEDGGSWDIHAGKPMRIRVVLDATLIDKDLYSMNEYKQFAAYGGSGARTPDTALGNFISNLIRDIFGG